MSRLQKRFADLKATGRKALIPFITAGDPKSDVTVPLLHALVEAGADVLELGIPFSDPMAEGPAIQHACERALLHHVSTHDVLNMVREFRKQDNETPIVLMGYLNPIEVLGYDVFAEAAVAAGADGMITVDLPPEEAEDYLAAFHKYGLDSIFLLAPTSTDARIKQVAAAASGFVYYVSLRGVTGASHIDTKEVQEKINIITMPDTNIKKKFNFFIKTKFYLLWRWWSAVQSSSASLNWSNIPTKSTRTWVNSCPACVLP